MLVLDEGDQLLDQGFRKAIETIVSYLPPSRQSLCFSATVPPSLSAVLGSALRPDRLLIDCTAAAPGEAEEDTHAAVEQCFAVSPLAEQLSAAYALVDAERQARPHP